MFKKIVIMAALMSFLIAGCIGQAIYTSGDSVIGGPDATGEVGHNDAGSDVITAKNGVVKSPESAKSLSGTISEKIAWVKDKWGTFKAEIVAFLIVGIFAVVTVTFWIRNRIKARRLKNG